MTFTTVWIFVGREEDTHPQLRHWLEQVKYSSGKKQLWATRSPEISPLKRSLNACREISTKKKHSIRLFLIHTYFCSFLIMCLKRIEKGFLDTLCTTATTLAVNWSVNQIFQKFHTRNVRLLLQNLANEQQAAFFQSNSIMPMRKKGPLGGREGAFDTRWRFVAVCREKCKNSSHSAKAPLSVHLFTPCEWGFEHCHSSSDGEDMKIRSDEERQCSKRHPPGVNI